jgi:hypothetical protein
MVPSEEINEAKSIYYLSFYSKSGTSQAEVKVSLNNRFNFIARQRVPERKVKTRE